MQLPRPQSLTITFCVASKGRREKIKHGRVAALAKREKWGNFHVPKETVHSGCTDSTQATARLVIVFVSRIQKSCARDISVRPTEMTRTFKAGSEYSGGNKLKSSVPFDVFDVPTEITGIFGRIESAPSLSSLLFLLPVVPCGDTRKRLR